MFPIYSDNLNAYSQAVIAAELYYIYLMCNRNQKY